MPGATACWHCTVPRHPKGAQGLSFPVGLQETPRAAFPLALSLKVAAELQRREGSACEPGAADRLLSSCLCSPKLMLVFFWAISSRELPLMFFSLCHLHSWGCRGPCTLGKQCRVSAASTGTGWFAATAISAPGWLPP